MAELLPLVPKLLEHIESRAGLRQAEIYRRLAVAMDMKEEAVKRNWLRWRSVTEEVNGRGRLAHARSLSHLAQAARHLGWLDDAGASGCRPLLTHLQEADERHRQELVASARRGMDAVRRQVRTVIRQQDSTAYDEVTWLSALFELVGKEVAHELKRRLLSADDPNADATLGNYLLSESPSALIQTVREAGMRPVLEVEMEALAMERRVRAEFEDAASHALIDHEHPDTPRHVSVRF